MPDVLVAYEFSHKNPRCVILTESEVLQGAVRIVKPPTLLVVGPALRMGQRKTDGLLLA